MRPRGVIFLDVDGVLCEWFKPFLTFDSVNQFSEWMALKVMKEDFRG